MKLICNFLAAFFAVFTFEATANTCSIDSLETINTLKKNTFKIVPRNSYAPTISQERARVLYQLNCLASALPLTEQLNCKVLANCTGELCKIEHKSFGTAFIAKGQPLLITAWHVVHATHEAALIFLEPNLSLLEPDVLNQTLAPIQPDFLLFDESNTLVYDTRALSQNASYAFWGNPLSSVYHTLGHAREKIYGYYENVPDDYVGITLAQSFLEKYPGLQLSQTAQKVDVESECLFSVGYEYLNEDFAIAGGRSSDIKSLLSHIPHMGPLMHIPLEYDIQTLRSLPVEKILPLMGYSPEQIKETLAKYELSLIQKSIQAVLTTYERTLKDFQLQQHPYVLFSDAPVLFGQSGGPIVNFHGEVIGITTNGFIDKSTSANGRFKSYGTSGLFIRALDQHLLPATHPKK